MENTPEVENKYTELTPEQRAVEAEKLKTAMSVEEKEKVFTIKTEVPAKTPEAKPEDQSTKKFSNTAEEKLEMVAQTLMSQAIERVRQHYKDFDVSGIVSDPSIDTFRKVTLLSTVAEPNAIKMANIEKNLKGNDTEGTGKTETKSAQFTAPEKGGKVDADAGEKLYTQMCEKLGLDKDETKGKSA